MLSTLGHWSLNISTAIYFVWFVPQILYNFFNKRSDFSHAMHIILSIGYMMDFLYGFGLHMPWQYRLVTCIGLTSLLVMHIQIAFYGLKTHTDSIHYTLTSIALALIASMVIVLWLKVPLSQAGYDYIGMISNACWFTFALPQLLRNHRLRSTKGLSLGFVMISCIIMVLDGLSAWCLNWDYPSKLGNALTGVERLWLLYQCLYYSPKKHPTVDFNKAVKT